MNVWNGSTPNAAVLNIATLMPPVSTPRTDIAILLFGFSILNMLYPHLYLLLRYYRKKFKVAV